MSRLAQQSRENSVRRGIKTVCRKEVVRARRFFPDPLPFSRSLVRCIRLRLRDTHPVHLPRSAPLTWGVYLKMCDTRLLESATCPDVHRSDLWARRVARLRAGSLRESTGRSQRWDFNKKERTNDNDRRHGRHRFNNDGPTYLSKSMGRFALYQLTKVTLKIMTCHRIW